MIRTNAMRLLDAAGLAYTTAEYEYDENDLAGVHAAAFLHIEPECFFKTLVLKGEKRGLLVCCIPTNCELDLKKAAKAFGEKKVEMLHVRDLLAATGYIRGGCSPIGMKKQLPVLFDELLLLLDEVYISAGTRGCALRMKPEDLLGYVHGTTADLTEG